MDFFSNVHSGFMVLDPAGGNSSVPEPTAAGIDSPEQVLLVSLDEYCEATNKYSRKTSEKDDLIRHHFQSRLLRSSAPSATTQPATGAAFRSNHFQSNQSRSCWSTNTSEKRHRISASATKICPSVLRNVLPLGTISGTKKVPTESRAAVEFF